MPKLIKRNEMEFHAALKKGMGCLGIRDMKTKHSKSIEISGADTFVSLPTGYAKCNLFSIFALLFD